MSSENVDLASAIFVDPRDRDPLRAVAEGGKPKRIKRFYQDAAVSPAGAGFAILLDGKPVKTPARQPLAAPTLEMAVALAQEWRDQGEHVAPETMPLTRLVNSALDGVAPRLAEVEADALKYADTDLICYRAAEPEALVKAQAEAWDPFVRFARETCGARLTLCQGVVFHPQPVEALTALADRLRGHVGEGAGAPFRLAALHVMTTLTGSLVIALAAALGETDADKGFAAAHVDEDYQMRVWGADEEALARRARRLGEMRAALQLFRLVGAD